MTDKPGNNTVVKRAMLVIVGILLVAAIVFYFVRTHIIQAHLPKAIAIDTRNQPTLGNANAKIHLVAFEDLKCGNCARFNIQSMPYIKKHLIDTGLANYTLINLAFVPGSMPAANAARCIYTQNKALFFDFTDYLFLHQPPEDQDWANVPNLMIDAAKIKGVNTDKLAQCLVSSPYDQFIQNNLKIAMKAMGQEVATPALYINGIKVDPLTQKQIELIIGTIK
ncbi:MAG: thioredoxin domain-containing protein [Gammaproteobacteria bacterium]|nr:thioredoxin domain-containing protein [Gammaproteobacteria bacterium]